ncbi:MAG: RlmE family RNA methyltransferase [Treponema sp.]|nr:RlmE family RNA methyltransferase [Treponema sp.]
MVANYKKPDYWQIKARKEGYPARSVYKLAEMDEKFKLLKHTRRIRILDLGAAPGSWSLYILRKLPDCFLVSADLAPLPHQFDGGLFSGENFRFIQGDITDAAVRSSIASLGPYQLMLSDAAPSTTGSRFIDTARSLELAEAGFSYSQEMLSSGGSLAIKVFQGGDTSELLKQIRSAFKSAKSYKPAVCRSESFETYYLGLEKN